jgi:hypothetical protein
MSPAATIRIAPARSIDDIDTIRGLFREYIKGLGIDLSFRMLATCTRIASK